MNRATENQSVVLSKLNQMLDNKFSSAQAQLISKFAALFYGSVAQEDINVRNVNDLYASLLSLWGFIQKMGDKRCKMRVFNPEIESHGWQSKHTIIELIHDDMPFLVDSVRMELVRLGLSTHLHIHVPMQIERDEKGDITAIEGASNTKGRDLETPMYLEIDRQSSQQAIKSIEDNLTRVLADVRATVDDWQVMKGKLRETVKSLEEPIGHVSDADKEESIEFLNWIADNHFTFMGYAHYQLKPIEGDVLVEPNEDSLLGLWAREPWKPEAVNLSEMPKGAQEQLLDNRYLLVLSKSNAISTVHRPAHIDYVAVKEFDKDGNVTGEHRFYGLYTSAAYSFNPLQIPVLRQKINAVMERSGFAENGHDWKALRNILETFPRDELFQISRRDLLNVGVGVVHMQERPVIRMFARPDPHGRYISALVYVPREIYNTKLRVRFMSIFHKVFKSTGNIIFTTHFSESILARIHFIIPVNNTVDLNFDLQVIEQELREAARSWEDNLTGALTAEFGEAQGKTLANRYAEAFPSGYRDEAHASTAVLDIRHMERLDDANTISMLLYRPQEETGGMLRFKLFHRDTPTPLSDVLPMLENMGLDVIGETPYKIETSDSKRWIMDFSMVPTTRETLPLDEVKSIFQEAFLHVWNGDAENDGFNRLVLGARLDWRETAILRAYAKYMWQIGFTFSQSYIEETLAAYPAIARQLVELFRYKFDPTIERDAEAYIECKESLLAALDGVANLDQDKILNRYIEVIEATVRTNFYQQNKDGSTKSYVSFKLNPRAISDMPLPVPMYEIFVYSPRVEGVHLRGGKVARGGLRWSDRREDFRTEILGLVKAQQVKNAVIVPVGAKGGFVCKRMPTGASRDEILSEGIECYKTFIRGLLDITDNYAGSELIAPEQVVSHDAADPYLVVAADKGTATFSDIANGIAVEYGFWLGDAFASGGSAGYDHKKMGITARGAWESVKRHFREMGIDCQTTDFTAIGIGDMGGDVFGNGMLCSRHIRLVGAFNHMHIFLDPNPDTEKSYEERERLFHLPRSSWEDYNPKLISKGGGVFLRSAKSIPLSKEVQAMLGIKSDSLAPSELIRAMLKAPVDLLWNGGIGTYVKAKSETNAEVGDRANDVLRVNGAELGCKVVGEGGNLGLTQLGRIEYMLRGGRANTDFIDNAGGVNCSDNEVNIKILLNGIVDAGDMTVKQRNKLLADMTEEVADIVLRENYRQVQSISITESRAEQMVKEHIRFIHWLERSGYLDRSLEALPWDEELIERKAQGHGLTRAELAVLLAYGKMVLKQSLLTKEVTRDPFNQKYLVNYFPKPLREKYSEEMKQHRLKDEIIAMKLANDMVDYMGSNFAYRIMDETGASPADVATCFSLSKEVFNMPGLWREIEALDNKIPSQTQVHMMYQSQRMIRRSTRWFLRHRRKNLTVDDGIAYFRDGIVELERSVRNALELNEAKQLDAVAHGYISQGVPEDLAYRVAYLSTMFSALDIVEMAKLTGLPIPLVAEVYYKLGANLELHWFLDQINLQSVDNHWQAFARAAFREELDWQQRGLTVAVLHMTNDKETAEERIASWVKDNRSLLERWRQMVADFRGSSRHEFAKFSVALRELLILVQSCIRAATLAREDAFLSPPEAQQKAKRKK